MKTTVQTDFKLQKRPSSAFWDETKEETNISPLNALQFICSLYKWSVFLSVNFYDYKYSVSDA